MNRTINLHEIRAEWERLVAAMDKALTGDLSVIERDILLDRLRELYEAIRSREPKAPMPEKPARTDVPIDRQIIDSLYGDDREAVPREEPPVESTEKPAEPEADPASPESSGKMVNETFGDDFSIDLASILASRTNRSLRGAIGLNDRLMLMNDLFDQDADLYERTLDVLDEVENMDDAYIYLYEHFTVDDSKEGVKLLLSLIEKKFM